MIKSKRVGVTLICLLTAVIIFAGVSFYSYDKERDECFDRLVGYTAQIGDQIKKEMAEDRQYLVHFSEQLAQYDLNDTNEIASELNIRGHFGLLSELELLLPNNQVVLANGKTRKASGELSFDTLKTKEEYITKRTSDEDDNSKQIVRHCVPLIKNGEVTAILCGVIDLADMPEFFEIYDYGNNYNVFVVEASTGMCIQDTWHDELGSINDFGNRDAKDGYSMEEFDEGIRNQKSSTVVFMSKSAGKYFYMHGSPSGVSDWMVLVNVLEPVVFAKADSLMMTFGMTIGLMLIVFAIYFLYILKDVRRENQDKEKQIRNITYMLAVEKLLFDAHIYQENFTKALQCVCEYLNAKNAFVWFIEDEWDSDIRYWSYNNAFIDDIKVTFKDALPEVYQSLIKNDGVLISQKNDLIKQFPSDGQYLSDHHVNNMMMIPVYDIDGKVIFVLGAFNIEDKWDNLEPLRQVALSFSMTVNHYEANLALEVMGTRDSLTGLLNRNSYNKAIDELEGNKPKSFGCVYIDVNGLHEINNYLGHVAGDRMLKTIAEKLKLRFSGADIYRIGGDEFVIFCKDTEKDKINESINLVKEDLQEFHYEISVGIDWNYRNYKVSKVIELAEEKMRLDKHAFYTSGGKERGIRHLNELMEKMIVEKEEAEAFLSVLEPDFKGVYFVDLNTDTLRYLFIPHYFEKIVEECDDSYSKAIKEYAKRFVDQKEYAIFEQITDYNWLKQQLDQDTLEGFYYHKTDGTLIHLRIIKFVEDDQKYKTQWIFKEIKQGDA